MSTEIPEDFWPQIDHQLERIATEKPDTFEAVRDLLLDLNYDQIVVEVHRNGPRPFDLDSAFFAGSGGDATLLDTLERAGWQTVAFAASYHYAMTHPVTGETLTYIEGDVLRGDHLSSR